MTTTPAPVYGGRYELRNQIARGGTAQVYLARDLLLDRPVALKALFPELSTDHTFVERFRREAQAAANLMHPNIVQVFDWGESDNTYFIVMEYIDGEPLSSIIRSQAPLSDRQAASIAADIAKALSYAHRHGVVHRDVKPGNVLITADGQVKVTDFGIARAIGADEQVTQTGLVMGTATYFSPEQAQGLAVDARSDVYSLGVVLYEMLTGRPPFVGETPVSIAYQHVREQPPAPHTVNPAVPPALEAIVLQAMAKLPAERYVSADELRADLDRYVHGQSVLASAPRTTTLTGPVTASLAAAGAGGAGGRTEGSWGGRGPSRGGGGREDGRARSTTPWWAAAGTALLVAIGAVVYFGGRSLGYFGGQTSFTLRSVVGLQLATAKSVLEAQGLKVTTSHDQASAAELGKVGRVRSQSPSPPARVHNGDTVHLVVWSSPPTATVPRVIGTTRTNAVAVLGNAGFASHVDFVKAQRSGERQGYVVRQDPAPYSRKAEGTTVTIDVVSGSSYVSVPNVSGDSVAAATVALINAGFKVSVKQVYQLSSTVPAGDVVGTLPGEGSSQLPGTKLQLVISKGEVSVPFLIGFDLASAEEALTQDGLAYRIALDENVSPVDVGLVMKTVPKAGTTVATGYQVVLFVGAENGSTVPTTTTTTLPGSSTSTTTLPGTPTTLAPPGSTTPGSGAPGPPATAPTPSFP